MSGPDSAKRSVGDGDEGGKTTNTVGPHLFEEHPKPDEKGVERAKNHVTRRKRPGLMIDVDEQTGGEAMAWLRGETLCINALHPAYVRVKGSHSASLYIIFVVASTLSTHVQPAREPHEFIQHFMASWGGME